MGTIPIIMARAVMITGRNRTSPARNAASSEFFPSLSSPVAKVTSKMLFEVATPMHMIAPIKEGTLSVVRVMKSIQIIPANAAGRAVMMMKGSIQDWKFTTMRK